MAVKKASQKTVAKSYSGDEIRRYIDVAKDEFGKESHRHMGALSEDFQHKVSAIAEQHVSVMQKLDEHGRILVMHSEMLGQLNVRTTTLQTDVSEIKKDIQEIKTDMKQKVDRSEFSRLERRVISLESLAHGGKFRR